MLSAAMLVKRYCKHDAVMSMPVLSDVGCCVSPPSAWPGELLRVRNSLINGNVEHELSHINTGDPLSERTKMTYSRKAVSHYFREWR